MDTRKAIGYVRVSTGAQAQDGVSLDAQESRIRAWCQAHEYELISFHSDAGASGGRADNRPGLQAALKTVCRARGALVVYSLSRLARSTMDAITIAERLDNCGADLVSLSERIDTTSAAGRMIFRMLAVLAEFERDQVSERTKAALSFKRDRGERIGGVPYGYRIAADGVALEPNPTEQPAVELIVSLRKRGQTLEQIRDALRERGIPNRRGNLTWRLNTISDVAKRAANGQ